MASLAVPELCDRSRVPRPLALMQCDRQEFRAAVVGPGQTLQLRPEAQRLLDDQTAVVLLIPPRGATRFA